MFREVNGLITNENIELEEIENANAYLLKHQFAFRRGDSTERKVFDMVAAHSGLFEKAFALFGFRLVVDNEHSYVGYVPSKKRFFMVTREQTILLLVLRVIYHRERIAGNSEQGVVLVTASQLLEVYKDLTGKEDINRNRAAFDHLIEPLREKHIISKSKDVSLDSNLPNIGINPCIQDVVNEEFAQSVIDQIIKEEQEERETEHEERETEHEA